MSWHKHSKEHGLASKGIKTAQKMPKNPNVIIKETIISLPEEDKVPVMSAPAIIRKEYGTSKNFMTPNVIKYGKVRKDIAYEVASGSGIGGGTMYGVSFVKLKPDGSTERLYDVSKSFSSMEQVNNYINMLKS